MSRLLRFAGLVLVSACAYAQGPFGTRAFVTNTPAGGVSVIDTATNFFFTSVSGFTETKGITATRDGTRVYVADYGATSVGGIDTFTFQKVADIPVPTKPNAVAVSPDGSRLYVASETGAIYVVDPFTKAILTTITPVGTHIFEHILINKAGTRLYVASQTGSGNVIVIDTSNNGVLMTIPTQAIPENLTLHANESVLYVATQGGLVQINTATNTFIRRDITNSNFKGVVVRPGTSDVVYLTSESAGTVSLWNTNNTFITAASAGTSVKGIAALDANFAYLTAPVTNKVLRFNLSNNTVDTTIDLFGQGSPRQIAIVPARQLAGCVPTLTTFASTGVAPAETSTGFVLFDLNPACAWTATSNVPWITIETPSGAGPGFVTYNIAANTSTAARTGAVFINGRRFLVTQSGTSCTYSITPGSKQAPASFDSAIIIVGAPAGCDWNATTTVPWIQIQPGTDQGSGSGYFFFTIAENTSPARRTGTVLVAGQLFTVTQAGSGATYACNAANFSFDFIRNEGLTEGLEDIRLTCSGPVPPGGATGDISVTLTAAISSRLTTPGSDDTDVWLILNNATNPVPGTTAFRGKLAGPSTIRFQNVPLTNVVNGSANFSIVNLRINATTVSEVVEGVVSGIVQIKSATFIPFSGDFVFLGIASPGFSTTVGETIALASGERMLPIVFTEFGVAGFRPKTKPTTPVTTFRYEAESLFMHPNLGTQTGLADTGTRLRLRIPVAAGVRVWAPVNLTGSPTVRLVSADATGLGGSFVTGTSMFGGMYQELTPVGGFATAVWEVTGASPLATESATANLVFQGGDLTAITRALVSSYAPTSTVGSPSATAPIPRFLDPLATPRIVNLRVVPVQPVITSSKNVFREVVGSNFRFGYQVINDGTDPASNVVVRGNIPPGFNYTSCSRTDGGACSASGTEVRAEVGQLNGGASITLNVQATQVVDFPEGAVLESSVSASSEEIDADLQSNQASGAFFLGGCPVTLSKTSATFGPNGGMDSFSFGSCPFWSVTADVPWITVSPQSGTGAGTVNFTVAPNDTTSARPGTIIAAGQTFTVNQAAGSGCGFSLASSSATVGNAGQKSTVQLTVTGTNCSWTASSPASWVQVYPLSGTTSTAVEYNVFPNFSTAARSAILTIGNRQFTVNQSSGLGNGNERFVQLVYFSFLGRFPTQQETAGQIAVLNGGVSRAQFILNFFNTAEFNLGGRFIAGLYVGLLNRDAEHSGWLFQRSALAAGGANQVGLVTNFLNSDEYKLKFGNPSNDEYVRLLYRYILLREASPSEVQFQSNALATISRVQLATNFLNSNEFRVGTGPRLTAFLLYATLLQRDASPADRSLRIAQITGGTPLIDLIAAFIGTPEFNALLN